MLHALRPYVTAGIAIAGAGVIAVTPITAPSSPAAQRSIEFSSVQLTSAALPEAVPTLDTQTTVEAWQNLFIFTGAYLSDAFVPVADNPTPILDQIFANQFYYANLIGLGLSYGSANMVGVLAGIPGTLSTAAAHLRAGDPEAAILTLWNFVETSVQQVVTPFISSLQIPMRITQNIANVAAAMPGMVLDLGLDVFETVSSTVRTTAASVQDIVDAASSGDPTAVANAIFSAPANIATALLVGDLAQGGSTAGLINGVLKNMVLARETIAEALGAPPREDPEGDATAKTPVSSPSRLTAIKNETATDTATLAESDQDAPAGSEVKPEAKSTLVRASAKAAPGTIGLTGTRSSEKPKLARALSDRVSATVGKIGADVKKALAKPDKQASTGPDADAGSGDDD
ncbi:hypothetical protein [Mycolicibacterium setense]